MKNNQIVTQLLNANSNGADKAISSFLNLIYNTKCIKLQVSYIFLRENYGLTARRAQYLILHW